MAASSWGDKGLGAVPGCWGASVAPALGWRREFNEMGFLVATVAHGLYRTEDREFSRFVRSAGKVAHRLRQTSASGHIADLAEQGDVGGVELIAGIASIEIISEINHDYLRFPRLGGPGGVVIRKGLPGQRPYRSIVAGVVLIRPCCRRRPSADRRPKVRARMAGCQVGVMGVVGVGAGLVRALDAKA